MGECWRLVSLPRSFFFRRRRLFIFDFQHKLKKLNPSLFVNDSNANARDGEWKVLGLYLRRTAQSERFTEFQKVMLDGDARRYIDAQESGHAAEHVCSVPANWVPERDIFGADGKLLAKGWRTIVMNLIARRIVNRERATAVFGTSLGETAYDRMSFEDRQRDATDQAGNKKILNDHRIRGFGSY